MRRPHLLAAFTNLLYGLKLLCKYDVHAGDRAYTLALGDFMDEFSKTEPKLLSAGADSDSRLPAAPPHPLDGQWYINLQDKTYGPYAGHSLKGYIVDGRMTEDTMVLPLGSLSWTKAKDDPVLSTYFSRHAPVATMPIANGRVSAGEGATVVQVTNNITQPSSVPGIIIDGPASPKSAGLALILSVLIPGLGQCYNGQIGKGILMFILCFALWFAMLGWIIWIWSAADAYHTAKNMNLRYMKLLAGGNVLVR